MDEPSLEDRVRALAQRDARSGVTERRMFGSAGFLVAGNLACGASGRGLLARVDREEHDALLDPPGVTSMVMRGRELVGWIRIAPELLADDAVLAEWVARSLDHAASLPPK